MLLIISCICFIFDDPMCYYTSAKMSRQEIYALEQEFGYPFEGEWNDPMYVASGFAHPKLPIITAEGKFSLYRWGLLPSWVKDWDSAVKLRVQTLNAIGDTIDSKPSFRGAVKAGRLCIVPVSGFYEWHHLGKEKYPFFVYPKDSPVFLMAGLYEQWTNKAIDEVHNTFTIITTAANPRMEWIHNSKRRMPVILSPESAKLWLDNSIPFTQKKELLVPFDENLMADHSISKLITSRKENPNSPAVMEPLVYPELALS